MDNFREVSEEQFFEFINSYPNRLSQDFFMDYYDWYDFTLVDESFERGTFEHIEPALLFRIYSAYGDKKYYVRKNIIFSWELIKPPVKDEDGAMVCAECGTYVFPRDYYCPRCGQKLKELDKSWPIKK